MSWLWEETMLQPKCSKNKVLTTKTMRFGSISAVNKQKLNFFISIYNCFSLNKGQTGQQCNFSCYERMSPRVARTFA